MKTVKFIQMKDYAHHHGWDPFEREKCRSSPCYQSCVDFCERWNQASFEPDYRSEPLSFFAPMVREVFARKAYDPDVTQKDVEGPPLLQPAFVN
jgi:predicted HD phosphohydrolase